MTDLEPWISDKTFADKYLPSIRNVIHSVANEILDIEVANEQDDQEKAFDYVVKLKAGEIACRVRRIGYIKFGDITLRAWRSSQAKTELQKIKEGFGKWYLYAWAKDNCNFCAWAFLDLDKLRASGLLNQNLPLILNPGHTTAFITLSILELLQNGCILRMQGEILDRLVETMKTKPPLARIEYDVLHHAHVYPTEEQP